MKYRPLNYKTKLFKCNRYTRNAIHLDHSIIQIKIRKNININLFFNMWIVLCTIGLK